ncbi:unnamed protein product [Polarella glacialis]|uniref:Uncharacterized protein n=1 Tax=Polarella glacialis TaxID=89957 RepID=A0A813FCV3_POLGL|nr:unnamed protein product [Polarella glacialis]CAE8736871.1 unnamed protein product [Polarella glacialis]
MAAATNALLMLTARALTPTKGRCVPFPKLTSSQEAGKCVGNGKLAGQPPYQRLRGFYLFGWRPNSFVVGIAAVARGAGKIRCFAAPRRGAAVDAYPKVKILCSGCGELLATYRKKNGTRSQLVKMYVERIAEDPHELLATTGRVSVCGEGLEPSCPGCGTRFCRGPKLVNGRPAWGIISGKVRMK